MYMFSKNSYFMLPFLQQRDGNIIEVMKELKLRSKGEKSRPDYPEAPIIVKKTIYCQISTAYGDEWIIQ